MDNIDLKSLLTEEEQKQLELIQKKIQSNLDEIYKKNVEDFQSTLNESSPLELDEASHPKHISTSQQEILISLRAEISTIDEKGHLSDIEQCLENYYHIPVAPNSDYKPLLEEFVTKFDNEVTTCAKRIYPENNGKQE